MDTTALGLLRKELIDGLGWNGARLVLTRFGFAHGWRTAESLGEGFPWDSESEWQKAGRSLHALLGFVVGEKIQPESGTPPLVHAIWKDSYEAEQHLLHMGRSEEPVCWSLVGFVSGYQSCSHNREVYAREVRCRGKGDAVCEVIAQPREIWGADIEDELSFYRRESLDAALTKVAEALKSTERKLQQHVRTLHSATES